MKDVRINRKVCVIGAGASGMCAAIMAARNGANVFVIEKNDKAGKKLSMTGNGRCNLTNESMSKEAFNENSREKVGTLLERFGVEDTKNFFNSLGISLLSEDGYIYPSSCQAQLVVSAMINEINRLNVKVYYNQQLKRIDKNENDSYLIKTSKDIFEADSVIVAVGGMAGPKTTMSTGDGYYILKSLGLDSTERYPALSALILDDKELVIDGGIRLLAKVSIGDISEIGELQLTSGKISGIPVMQLSRYVKNSKNCILFVDFFPELSSEQWNAMTKNLINISKDGRTVEELLNGIGNQALTKLIAQRAGYPLSLDCSKLTEDKIFGLLSIYRNLQLKVKSTSDFYSAQVTTGGIIPELLNDNLESIDNKGLFVVGEIVDVDGRCGGYNLQWAWSSAVVAALSACGLNDEQIDKAIDKLSKYKMPTLGLTKKN